MSEHHPPPTVERHCDVAVIGGSAAGLAAALQLGRQRRATLVVDAGKPRNGAAARMHSYLGHEGIPPGELAAIGRDEVRRYGVEVTPGQAVAVTRRDDGRFVVELAGGSSIVGRRVLVATGLVDEVPDIDGLAEHWGREVIHCPFCHGYEVRDRRIVAILTHPMGLHPAGLFRQLTSRLTVVRHAGVAPDLPELDALRGSGVAVVDGPVGRITTGPDGRLAAVETAEGVRLEADAVAITPRFRVRAEPLGPLGIEPVDHPTGLGDHLEVGPTGETAVPGVYAAGNVTDPSQQVLQAAANGGRVGAMIAADLAAEDIAAAARPSGGEADWDRRYGGDRVWSGNPNGALVAEIAELAPGRALDVGAGEGGDAVWLAERGWAVTASDISGQGLARAAAEADRRGLAIECLHVDANALDAFEPDRYDLVTSHYPAIPRTPDGRGVENLLAAVAPGGTLLVVHHDPEPMRRPIDVAVTSRPFDPDAYVRVADVAAAVRQSPGWTIEVDETRPRPAGAASRHTDDVVLRARRTSW